MNKNDKMLHDANITCSQTCSNDEMDATDGFGGIFLVQNDI